MNNEQLDQRLHTVAAETFEMLALMFLMPEEDADGFDQKPTKVVRVDFAGPFNGTLFLAVSESMLPELAGNMLGLLDDGTGPSLEQQHDALKELINVICGNVLPSLAGTEPVFQVCAPELCETADIPETHNGQEPSGAARMFLDAGAATMTLFVDEPAAVSARAEG